MQMQNPITLKLVYIISSQWFESCPFPLSYGNLNAAWIRINLKREIWYMSEETVFLTSHNLKGNKTKPLLI